MYKDLIRKRIKEKYKTIENFATYINIPRTTINFILKNGIGSSNYDMVNKIFKALDIYPINDCPIVIDKKILNFLRLFNSLDDIGKHTVTSVAETEYRRINPDIIENAIIAAYGSLSSSDPLTDEEKSILDLVEKIKTKEHKHE